METVTPLILQYGSFGVVVFLVVWFLHKGFPSALATHREVCEGMLKAFQADTEACRKERLELAQKTADEREKDRKVRHDLVDKMQEVIAWASKFAGPNAPPPPLTVPSPRSGTKLNKEKDKNHNQSEDSQ